MLNTIKLLNVLLIKVCLVSCDPNSVTKESVQNTESQANERTKYHQLAKQGHKPLSYRSLWEPLKRLDGADGKVMLIYSRKLRDDHLHSSNEPNTWNREHLWVKSCGIGKTGADYTDLHNLRPCDSRTNSRRGNKFYDVSTDKDSWEPADEVKGDIARAMFYMAVRYEGGETDTIDLELGEETDYDKGVFGKLSTLLKWHKDDPVSDEERKRNDLVEEMQGNRNPFVDEPEAVGKVFGL